MVELFASPGEAFYRTIAVRDSGKRDGDCVWDEDQRVEYLLSDLEGESEERR